MHNSFKHVTLTGVAVAAAVTLSSLALGVGSASAATSARPNGSGQAKVSSISCTSAGNCAAAGYLLPPGQNRTFVVSEKNGTWGKSELVPGLSALPGGSVRATLDVVSCSSAGNCSAGGLYVDHSGAGQAFVVSEKSGVWGNAEEVPALAALNVGGEAVVEQISCKLAGGCLATGTYENDSSMDQQAFVVAEVNGVWGDAEEIAGLDALNVGGVAEVRTLYCVHTGNCTVGGDYNDGHGSQPFVAYQNYGEWYSAQTFPDIAAANTGGIASIDSLSCARRGVCTGVGDFRTADGDVHVFSISEQSYVWGAFQPIPGMAALPTGGEVTGTIGSLNCPSPGNCTAGGDYADPSKVTQPYVVSENNGVWGNASVIPGAAGLGQAKIASLNGLSCASAGNCTATGTYIDNLTSFDGRVYVASEQNGTWGKAENLPGSVTLSQGKDIETGTVACGSPGNCALGGTFAVGASFEAPFLDLQKNGAWGKPAEVPGIHP